MKALIFIEIAGMTTETISEANNTELRKFASKAKIKSKGVKKADLAKALTEFVESGVSNAKEIASDDSVTKTSRMRELYTDGNVTCINHIAKMLNAHYSFTYETISKMKKANAKVEEA